MKKEKYPTILPSSLSDIGSAGLCNNGKNKKAAFRTWTGQRLEE
jgi:hypothetical protein